MFQKADEPFLADFIEERSDIGVQYVVHLGAGDADHQCVQRIVLAALGSKSVREPKELLLVDRVQHATVALWMILSSRAAIAKGRWRPSGFGICRRRDGCARYTPRWTRACRSSIRRSRSVS